MENPSGFASWRIQLPYEGEPKSLSLPLRGRAEEVEVMQKRGSIRAVKFGLGFLHRIL